MQNRYSKTTKQTEVLLLLTGYYNLKLIFTDSEEDI